MWIKRSVNPAKGAVAGLIGGLFASWVMNQFQAGMKKVSTALREEDQEADRWSGPQARGQRQSEGGGEDEPATVKAAVAVSENVFHHHLAKEERQPAGAVIHYAYGAAIGALYGWAAETSHRSRMASGTVFGAALWLASDEIGVPIFKLSKAPQEYPLSAHASALGAHVVYGVTTELVRRTLRARVLRG